MNTTNRFGIFDEKQKKKHNNKRNNVKKRQIDNEVFGYIFFLYHGLSAFYSLNIIQNTVCSMRKKNNRTEPTMERLENQSIEFRVHFMIEK